MKKKWIALGYHVDFDGNRGTSLLTYDDDGNITFASFFAAVGGKLKLSYDEAHNLFNALGAALNDIDKMREFQERQKDDVELADLLDYYEENYP